MAIREETERKREKRIENISATECLPEYFYAFLFYAVCIRMRMDNIARRKEESEPESLVSDVTMDKLEVIEKAISEYYYQKDVSTEDMIDGMYQGVVAALGDPYSTYYTEEDLEDLMQQTEGIYYGIGAYVGMDAQTGMAYI